MIYAASTVTDPAAYGRIYIYILCLHLPFIFYLIKSVRKLVTWQKLAFSEVSKCTFPDLGTGAVCLTIKWNQVPALFHWWHKVKPITGRSFSVLLWCRVGWAAYFISISATVLLAPRPHEIFVNVVIFSRSEKVLECLRTDDNILAFKSKLHVYLCSVQHLVMLQLHLHCHKSTQTKFKNFKKRQITVTV